MSVSKRIQVAIRSPSIAVNGGTKFNMSLDKGNKCSRTAIATGYWIMLFDSLSTISKIQIWKTKRGFE